MIKGNREAAEMETLEECGPRIRRAPYEPEIVHRAAADARCPTCGTALAEPAPQQHDVPTVYAVEPRNDPAVALRFQRLVVLILEAFDGSRSTRQLESVLAAPALRYLKAVAPARRPGRATRLKSVRVYQPTSDSAEVAAVVFIAGRPRALVARFDRNDTDQWQCAALRMLL